MIYTIHSGPGVELLTIENAARFVGPDEKPWRQAPPHWDFADELLLKAAETGKGLLHWRNCHHSAVIGLTAQPSKDDPFKMFGVKAISLRATMLS